MSATPFKSTCLEGEAEVRECLRLLLAQIDTRSIDLKDVPELLCAIDKQTVERARKALRSKP